MRQLVFCVTGCVFFVLLTSLAVWYCSGEINFSDHRVDPEDTDSQVGIVVEKVNSQARIAPPQQSLLIWSLAEELWQEIRFPLGLAPHQRQTDDLS